MKRLLLLFVWLVLTPCFVQASCGDWLTHPGDELPAIIGGNDRPGEESSTLASKTIPRVPCDAPGCRQAPADSPVPAATPQVESKWLTWSKRGTACPAEALTYPVLDSDGNVLDGFSPTIERPPQS